IDRAGAVPYAEVKFCPTCSATFSDSVAFCAHDGTALRSREGLEPGTVIRKKYQIISELGRGGMAVVDRVRHLIWNEDKALKIMLNTGEGGLADQGVSFRSNGHAPVQARPHRCGRRCGLHRR